MMMCRCIAVPISPTHRILADWDEMDTRGGLSLNAPATTAAANTSSSRTPRNSPPPTPPPTDSAEAASDTSAPAVSSSSSSSRRGGARPAGDGDDAAAAQAAVAEAAAAEAADSAYAAVLVRRHGASLWSTVNFELAREDGCWLIDRLWVDDKGTEGAAAAAAAAVGGGGGGGAAQVAAALCSADLLSEAANEAMGCRFGDYDPAQLVSWLEQEPSEELTPKVRCSYAYYYSHTLKLMVQTALAAESMEVLSGESPLMVKMS
jgi:hypothetical protein